MESSQVILLNLLFYQINIWIHLNAVILLHIKSLHFQTKINVLFYRHTCIIVEVEKHL